MTNKEYKELIETKYGKSLKEVMYELCVERGLDPWEGSEELGVPKKTFVAWRTQFRFGPDQRRYDRAEQMRNETVNEYKKQLENIDIRREFVYGGQKSLKGFREMIERKLELEKLRRSKMEDTDSFGDMSVMLRIGIFEGVIDYLDEYENMDKSIAESFSRDIEILELFLNMKI
ncbi:hypothetical protein YDYSG_03370 [Paenibacillus tyrfis]|nr:hypothetical protein YDYSG_03370 [Paenibacillus tyrfis]